MLTVQAAAKRLGVTRQAIDYYCRSGRLAYTLALNGDRQIHEPSLTQLAKARQQRAKRATSAYYGKKEGD